MELRRLYDELCDDEQQALPGGHRGRLGNGLAALRLDLHRAPYANGAEQPRGLRKGVRAPAGKDLTAAYC